MTAETRDHLLNWEYPEFVDKRCGTIGRDREFLGPMGLCGESGEVMELFKKSLTNQKPVDRDELLLEMGDVFWYLTLMMIDHGFSLSDICNANMEKLRKRHGVENERK